MAASFKVYAKGRKKRIQDVTARILLKDPLVEKSLPGLGRMVVTIQGETCLGPGPTSSRVAVVDYNGHLEEVYEPAQLHSDGSHYRTRGGPLETDFYFHQINVWATIHRTLELLEAPDVFGRRIPWAFPGGRLKVLPHAGYDDNAYYDRNTGALHFFYFEGRPGVMVFTCLSHDIITHELGHAVLDGLKPYYNEVSSAATAGFHEYFGDAIALTSALSHREIMVQLAGRSDSVKSKDSFVANIAQQFGSGLPPEYGSIQDAYLRNAQNEVTMTDLKGVHEEHDYSEVLTGAYYDLLELIYDRLMVDRDPKSGHDRVRSLYSAAEAVRRMMLRALDYCPPVDLTYLDYAQAVYRADRTAYPVDAWGYRKLWCQVARKRRIATAAQARESTSIRNCDLRHLDIETLAASKTDAYEFVDANRAVLRIPPTANVDVINLYRTRKISSDDFHVPEEIVIEFVWSSEVRLTGAKFGGLRGSWLPLWCGGTLVFNREGNLLHYVLKPDSAARRAKLSGYAQYLVEQDFLTVDDGERGFGSASQGMHKVFARIENGRVSLRRNAAMRHARPGYADR